MKETDNYKLKKPEPNDYINIEDLNDNADIIDEALSDIDSGAQDKANQALSDAKEYTDDEIEKIPEPTWENIKEKPSIFPPSSHNHDVEDINGLNQALDNLDEDIGKLNELDTDEKDSLVKAVNDLKSQIGNLSNLDTDEKSNLVKAVNDLATIINAHQAKEATENELGHVRVDEDTIKINSNGVIRAEKTSEEPEKPFVTGTYTGTGGSQTITLGFTPGAVIVYSKVGVAPISTNQTTISGFALDGFPNISSDEDVLKIVENGFKVRSNDRSYLDYKSNDYNPFRYIAFK